MGVFAAWRLVLKRSFAHWRLLLPVIVGVLLAVSFMASGFIYADSLKELGLRYALAQPSAESLDVQLRSSYNRGGRSYFDRADSFVNGSVQGNIGWFAKDTTRHLQSATFYIARPGQPVYTGADRPRGFFQSFSALEGHIELIEGGRQPTRLITPTDERGLPTEKLVLEAAVGEETARNFGLKVGDKLIFIPYWEDINSDVSVLITGIITPKDPEEEYWLGNTERFTYLSRDYQTVPLFLPEETLLDGLSPIFPRMTVDFTWMVYVDPEIIDSSSSELARWGLINLKNEFSTTMDTFMNTPELANVLGEYDTKLFYSRIPLFVLILLVVGIVLYYIATVSAMIVEAQRGEIALLRCRGASTRQILVAYLLEGLAICGPGAVLGPFIAVSIIKLLGKLPVFSHLSGGAFLPATLTTEAWLLALLGSALCMVVLLIPVYQGAKGSVIQYKQHMARPSQSPFYQRYYLDIFVIILGAFLYWELTRRGSLLSQDLFGRIEVDKVLLVAPAIFMISVSVVFLRLFPIILQFFSKLISPIANVWLLLGIWQIVRNPTHYARLILLLMMATSLGIFAASFGGTLDRSYRDRALYQAGTDVRLEGELGNQTGISQPFLKNFQEIPQIEHSSPVMRASGTVSAQLFSGQDYTILGLDPSTFPNVSWYRSDFSSRSLNGLMNILNKDVSKDMDKLLPENAQRLGLWVLPDQPLPSTFLFARLKDANGRFFDYLLGELDNSDWRYLETNLERTTRAQFTFGRGEPLIPRHPLTFQSLYIQQLRGSTELPPGAFRIDDLQVRTASGEMVVLEDFENITDWRVLKGTVEATSDTLESTSSIVHSGISVGRFSWASGDVYFIRGIYAGANDSPISAIASDSFLQTNGYSVGDVIEVASATEPITAKIVASVHFFPTLDPDEESFLIVNLNRLIHNMNLTQRVPDAGPNEVWLSTQTSGEERAALLKTLSNSRPSPRQIVDLEEIQGSSKADPLVAAGWNAILFIIFVVVLFLTVVGFLVHSYLTVQQRELEFAMLRTMGLSFRQLVGLVWFEHAFIIFIGMAFGTWMGMRLGTIMMPYLGLTEEGLRVLPPFITEVNWAAVTVAYTGMALAFAIIISGLVWVFSRLVIQRALKLGEV